MKPISLLFSLALFAACGVSPAASPTTYQDFAIAQSQITCEAQYRCCALRCVSNDVDPEFNKPLLSAQKLIDAGKVTYDANAGKTCLDSYRARVMDCQVLSNNLSSISPTCAQVLVGKIAVGQTCDPTLSNLCVSGSYCDSTMASPVCTSYLADNASCAMGGRCLSTSYCDSANTDTCKPLPKSGQACTGLVPCDSTTTKLVCLPSMTCGAPAPDGAMCASNAQCANGVCGGTGTNKTCQASTTPPSMLRDTLCK